MRLTPAEYARLKAKREGKTAAPKQQPDGGRWEVEFAAQLDELQIPYVREHRFQSGRRWRFDFAIPQLRIAVEIDGAVHRIKGRFDSDREKMNAALVAGWRVVHVTPTQVRSGEAMTLLLRVLLPHAIRSF